MTQQYTLPKGTICKINGIPFELKEDTVIYSSNWELMHEEKTCAPDPSREEIKKRPICRVYQYPAETLNKVAALLGIENEFAELKTLTFELSSCGEDHGFPPILVIQASGKTHYEQRCSFEKIMTGVRRKNNQSFGGSPFASKS